MIKTNPRKDRVPFKTTTHPIITRTILRTSIIAARTIAIPEKHSFLSDQSRQQELFPNECWQRDKQIILRALKIQLKLVVEDWLENAREGDVLEEILQVREVMQ